MRLKLTMRMESAECRIMGGEQDGKEMEMEMEKWDCVGYSTESLSEMFQKVQLAAMKMINFTG